MCREILRDRKQSPLRVEEPPGTEEANYLRVLTARLGLWLRIWSVSKSVMARHFFPVSLCFFSTVRLKTTQRQRLSHHSASFQVGS